MFHVNRNHLNPFVCRSNSYKNSFFHSVLDGWNNLDISSQYQHSRETFRKQIIYTIPPPLWHH